MSKRPKDEAMSKFRVWFLLMVSIGAGFVVTLLWEESLDRGAHHPYPWFLLFFWGIIVLGFFRPREKSNVKPTSVISVRDWTRYSITAVCAKEEYELWQLQHKRAVEAGLERENDYPSPKYVGYFTDHPERKKELGDFWTGTMQDYCKVTQGCLIETSQLFIPDDVEGISRSAILESYGCVPVELPERLYFLIHGKFAPRDTFTDE
jgi:hypothetical protein